MNAVPLPLLHPDVPGAPRTETRAYDGSLSRFGSPVAAPRLDSPEISTDEVTTLRLQLAAAQGIAAALERELDRARADLRDELAVTSRLLTRAIEDGDRLTKAEKYAADERRNGAAWERECVKLLLEVYKLKAEIAERDAGTVVVEVGL